MAGCMAAGHSGGGRYDAPGHPGVGRGPAGDLFFRLPLMGRSLSPSGTGWDEKRKRQSLADIQAREGEREPLFAKIRHEELRREFP